MASVLKLLQSIRNHWKKSTFAACAIAYGANYAKESYEIQDLMQSYCKEAQKHGLQPLSPTENPRKVLVVLNPTANRRKAVKQFEQYCVPILHLAGICVDVIHTKSEGHARKLLEENKDKSDSIIIAGGDGTVSESITGLLRRRDNYFILESCSIGILPLGRTNSFAKTLFYNKNTNEKLNHIQRLADASMAIVKERTKRTNVMKIEIIPDNVETEQIQQLVTPNKPIYALSGMQWGSYRDAHSKQDKYWYFGGLRKYVTYIFNGYKSSLNWNCTANITYSPPCAGCSNCFQDVEVLTKAEVNNNQNQTSRWWYSYASKTSKSNYPESNLHDNLKYIQNDNCSNVKSKRISTSDFNLFVDYNYEILPKLILNIGSKSSNISYFNFINQGWKSENGQARDIDESIEARQIELIPKMNEQSHYYSIDNENFEVKSIRVTLLPKIIKVFCN